MSNFNLTFILIVKFYILDFCRAVFPSLQTANAKELLLRISLNFTKPLFRDRFITYIKIGGDFFDITFLWRFYCWHCIIELYYAYPCIILSCTVYVSIYAYKYFVAKLCAYLLLCINYFKLFL